jgi:hypothetical protein
MGLINKREIREMTEFQISEEYIVGLEKQIRELIKRSEERSKENSRRTLLKRDL